ncbi:glycosyl hydrolase family 18 protein [Pyrococcus sp. ST04]|uniref:glycosyl hydrolase family 18 protein n=1 Tax=Pyrococcus sp. ST04 TaxID=1183377 RepID=UPI0009DAE17B|nr:glycosyl hydrolase family 18 protein [Pyrococcus sp. ST04]
MRRALFLVMLLCLSAIPIGMNASATQSEFKLIAHPIAWDAVNLTWTPIKDAKAYEVYRSLNVSDIVSSENLVFVVNWSSHPRYKENWNYLPGEIVEYHGYLWRAKRVTSQPPGEGEDWEKVGPITPTNTAIDYFNVTGNTTYYYAVVPIFKDGKKGEPSNIVKVTTPPQPYRIVVYYISWGIYARAFSPYDIPFENVTHVNYAFLKLLENGTVTWADPWADPMNLESFKELKRRYPAVKFLISVGGWTLSKYFSPVAADPKKREEFIRSAISIIRKYNLDGIDIDWEYPGGGGMEDNYVSPDDPKNFIILLREFREALDKAGKEDKKHYLLTVAAPASIDIASRIDWEEASKYLDFINVMTYDYAGPWSPVTAHNAPLYKNPNGPDYGSVNETIMWYLRHVPDKRKIVLGLPFYARSFANVPPKNNGLFQPYSGTPAGTWGSAAETHGVMDYWDVAEKARSEAYEYFWDDYSQVPWLYSRQYRIFITFDDPKSIYIKTRYMLNNSLGGVMVWEITADRKPGTHSHPLLDAILRGLEEKPPAWIPDKYYLGTNIPQNITIPSPETVPYPKKGICGPGIAVLLAIGISAFLRQKNN